MSTVQKIALRHGEHLAEELKELKMSTAELALQIGGRTRVSTPILTSLRKSDYS
jgi:hypothetical protein